MNRRIGKQLSRMSGLPESAVLSMPEITISGDTEVRVDVYGKLAEYSPSLVRLATPYFTVRIDGTDLKIRHIDAEVMRIGGHIASVALE